MSGGITREVIGDPLALNANANAPLRQLSVPSVNNPRQRSLLDTSGVDAFGRSMDVLSRSLNAAAESAADNAITEGKIAFMQGKTEDEIARTGNKFTMQGYQTLSTVDTANRWFQQEMLDMDNTASMNPAEYRQHLADKNRQAMENLPADPVLRKLHVAAYEDLSPRLASEQAKRHNEYNEKQTLGNFKKTLISTSSTSPDRSNYQPTMGISVSNSAVGPSIYMGALDRDNGIRTILGEAGAEGPEGQAAVAHVIRNRMTDRRWGGSVTAVVKAPWQFSVWNATEYDGGIPSVSKISMDSPSYIKAGQILDAVMAGRTVDNTNGATHYYSPKGMEKLVASGRQKNLVPSWYAEEAAKGRVTIGNHLFAGKTDGSVMQPVANAYAAAVTDTGVAEAQAPLAVGAGVPAQAVAAEEGIPTDGSKLQGNTQAQQLVLGQTNIPAHKRATAVAEAMIQDFGMESSGVYDDLGGEAMLQKLGATPEEIAKVTTAREAFKKKRLSKYDVNVEKRRAEIEAQIESGEMDAETARGKMEELIEEGIYTNEEAQSLARKAAVIETKGREDDKLLDPKLQEDLGNVYDAVRGGLPLADAISRLEEIGSSYGVSKENVRGFLQQMYKIDETEKNRKRTALEGTIKEKATSDRVKAEVDASLSRGWGLKDIKGNVIMTDEQGNKITASASDYAIDLIREREGLAIDRLIQEGKIDPNSRGPMLDKVMYETLAKQNIFDTKFGGFMAAAMKGNILTDGKVSEGALMSADFYIRARDNPNIGPAYLAQMMPDEQARTFYETVYAMNDARPGSMELAVRRAHEYLNTPINEKEIGERKTTFFNKLPEYSKQAIEGVTGGNGWVNTYLARNGQYLSPEDAQVAANDVGLRQYITNRAVELQMNDMRASPDIIMKKATQDAVRDTVIVLGKPIVGNATRGQRIDQVMGLTNPAEVDAAVRSYLYDNGDTFWDPKVYGIRQGLSTVPRVPTSQFAGGRTDLGTFNADNQAMDVTYNPSSQTITIQRYHEYLPSEGTADTVTRFLFDAPNLENVVDQRKPMGVPITVSVKDISKHYNNKMKATEEPGLVSEGWDSLLGSWRDSVLENNKIRALQRRSPSDNL